MTRLGGSQYVDSEGLGAYASYLVEEFVVPSTMHFEPVDVGG